MAKKKQRRGRQSLASKALNGLGIAIGLSRIIEIVIRNFGNPANILPRIISGATGGLSEGSFDITEAIRFYVPMAATIPYAVFKSHIIKKFPMR